MKTEYIFGKPVTEVIRARKSIRTYRSEIIPSDFIDKLTGFLNEIQGPFPVPFRFQLINTEEGKEGSVNPGTGGVIRGANVYLAAIVSKEGRNLEQLGYVLEKAILFAAASGLGTCWLGGTFSRSNFEQAAELKENEALYCVTPLGYPALNQGLMNSFVRMTAGSSKRKEPHELFYSGKFDNPVNETILPLEMVRLAPSASNKQPWRVLAADGKYHFYLRRTPGYPKLIQFDIQRIDIGIAMCHFELTALESGMKGHWSQELPDIENTPENTEFIVSWIP